MNRDVITEILVSGLTRHTAQAIGGALTYTGINPGNGLSPDDFGTAAAGVLIQTAAFAWSAWRKRRRAKKAAQNKGAR